MVLILFDIFFQDPFAEDDFTQTGKGKDFMYDREEDEVETCKPVILSLILSRFKALFWRYLMFDSQNFFFLFNRRSHLNLKSSKNPR